MRNYQPRWITVVERVRVLGYEITSKEGAKISQSVGSKAREKWMEETHTEPHAELRKKTNGGGSHMKCVYPPNWIETIDEFILESAQVYDPALSTQLSLFEET